MQSRLALLSVGILLCGTALCSAELMPVSTPVPVVAEQTAPAPSISNEFASPSRKVLLGEAALFSVLPAPLALAAVPAAQAPVGSPVPEPSSLVLLASGLLSMAEVQRRRRRSRA